MAIAQSLKTNAEDLALEMERQWRENTARILPTMASRGYLRTDGVYAWASAGPEAIHVETKDALYAVGIPTTEIGVAADILHSVLTNSNTINGPPQAQSADYLASLELNSEGYDVADTLRQAAELND